MKKFIYKISTFSIIFSLLMTLTVSHLPDSSTVHAIDGDLTVDWGVIEPAPIFTVANWAPGQTETKPVTITNGGSGIRPVGVKGIAVDDSDNLSQAIDFKIAEGAVDLWGGTSPTGPKTLADFFSESNSVNGIFLLNISSSATKNLSFTAKFKDEAGNEFQGTQVTFNITIGISIELPEECEQIEFSGNPIFGTSRGDSLKGTFGNDLIVGFEGGDSIDGKSGDDCILGGAGGDSLKGDQGNDVILGGLGGDSIKGDNGQDLIFGEEGNDSINGGNNEDKIFGGDGHDSIDGSNENDIIFGGRGDDSISGENGNDELYGEEGKDSIKGGGGNDTLIGGDGNFDSANGNGGTDTCEAESESNCEL